MDTYLDWILHVEIFQIQKKISGFFKIFHVRQEVHEEQRKKFVQLSFVLNVVDDVSVVLNVVRGGKSV